MQHGFDPGYGTEPYRTLCANYPGSAVYPAADFRLEWGPIFHRGRLDGTARVLAIGQDPAESENITRRILVGTAGRRFQGFLARLGITRSYVMVNTFLYSVYGGSGSAHLHTQAIVDYRNRWLDALASSNPVQAVVALGSDANTAWESWDTAVAAKTKPGVAFQHITHPTFPERTAGKDRRKLAAGIAGLLRNWNHALVALRPALKAPDVPPPQALFGRKFERADLVEIPEEDLPPGLPAWMRNEEGWAKRRGRTAAEKRATIVVTAPGRNLP